MLASVLTFTRIYDPSPLAPQVAEVYGSAFSIFRDGPTEQEVRAFSRQTLPQQTDREGFQFVAALEDDVLLGFIYGFHGRSGEPWEDWVRARVPLAVYDEWFDNQFDLTEFCVRADRHGEGIGSRLYETLFAELAQAQFERAVLTTRRVANPARDFYLRRGWEVAWEALDDRFSLFGLRLGK
jgi:GNAT superfamily N-acetyltransferase